MLNAGTQRIVSEANGNGVGGSNAHAGALGRTAAKEPSCSPASACISYII